MSIHTILKWAFLIAVVSWVVSNPTGAASLITGVVGGVIDFFKALISGLTNAFQ